MTRGVITAEASCRADLAGGTLDIWPLYLFHPGSVTVNFALSILTRCGITPLRSNEVIFESLDTGVSDAFASVAEMLAAKKYKHQLAGQLCRYFLSQPGAPQQGFRMVTDSHSPAGAGISGSSALMIATTAAMARFCGMELEREHMRVIAQNIEAQLIHVPTGCQDYYPALFGGVNAVHLGPGGIHCESLSVPQAEIDRRFLLVYTGAPRKSGINNWEVFKAHVAGNKRVLRNFDTIAAIARDMRAAVLEQDWKNVSRLLHAEWKHRKTNAPGITTPLIEKLVKAALKQGARAAKICGAGGGGCFLVFVEPDAREAVAQALTRNGGQVLEFHVADRGVTVTELAVPAE